MILHGIEYQRPTSLNMRIMADHVTYSFLAFMKSIFHFCLGCYCGGYSQNGRSNLSSCTYLGQMAAFPSHVYGYGGAFIVLMLHLSKHHCTHRWLSARLQYLHCVFWYSKCLDFLFIQWNMVGDYVVYMIFWYKYRQIWYVCVQEIHAVLLIN